MGCVMGEGMAQTGALLLGRRTYEDFAGYWPHQTDNPSPTSWTTPRIRRLDDADRTTALEELNAASGRRSRRSGALKDQPGPDIAILGSGELIQSLRSRNLIDEYILLIHPLILGSGRLFPDGAAPSGLRLTNSVTTTAGVVIATYQTV
jgi:dihydrofolate reductase